MSGHGAAALDQNLPQLEQILFMHIGARARTARRFPQPCIVVTGDNNDPRLGERRFDLPSGRKPVHLFHLDVHQDPIRVMLPVSVQRLHPITALGEGFCQITYQLIDHLAHGLVVLDN